MTAISKNVYFDVLNDIINKYNNTFHRTIKMKPIDVKSDSYLQYNVDLKQVIISKYQNTKTNQSEEVFVVSKIKKTVPWNYVINDLNGEEITGTFYEKELQKPNQKEFRIEKVIKRKGNKLYVRWKDYNNSFNSWIDKKDIL